MSKTGIAVEVEEVNTVTVIVKLSRSRAECIAHQAFEALEICNEEFGADLADFANELSDALAGRK